MFSKYRHERLVECRVVHRRIMKRGHDAEDSVSQAVQLVVVGEIAGTNDAGCRTYPCRDQGNCCEKAGLIRPERNTKSVIGAW